MAVTVQIGKMRPDDWEAVRAIYEDGLATGFASFETISPKWQIWDRDHLPCCRLVARLNGMVAGWAALSPVSKRQAYAGAVEVSIYVAAHARGQGVGKALLSRLISESETAGLWTLQATIFAENGASQALHAACGFRTVGRRERIAQRNEIWHDTIIMERRSATVGTGSDGKPGA